jgi:hypothetical protein
MANRGFGTPQPRQEGCRRADGQQGSEARRRRRQGERQGQEGDRQIRGQGAGCRAEEVIDGPTQAPDHERAR